MTVAEMASPPLQRLLTRMNEELESDRCTLYAVDLERRELWSLAAIGLEQPEIRLSTRRGMVGYVARTGQVLRLKDAYNDPRFDRSVDRATGYRTRSALTMAVRNSEQKIVAVLQALNKHTGAFTDADEERMARYATEVTLLL
jgi:adenylate cyclase